MNRPETSPDIHSLISLFYQHQEVFGKTTEVLPAELPTYANYLLNHQGHMTETMERFHRGPVTVAVLDRNHEGESYQRKILLARKEDKGVVQFGIVRLYLKYLPEDVQTKILAEERPLGRILIENEVLRKVELTSLWKIEPGDELLSHFQNCGDRKEAKEKSWNELTTLYGRTAMIYCNGEPAIELLEIASPYYQILAGKDIGGQNKNSGK
ncbi:MAG: hypothetical protein MPJ24_02695 [Pirellulaceae bacterium]|nr:hypothetical protein [Pirellulaceae bacterium]